MAGSQPGTLDLGEGEISGTIVRNPVPPWLLAGTLSLRLGSPGHQEAARLREVT